MVKNKKYLSPLLCWDIYSVYFDTLIAGSKSNGDVDQLQSIIGRQLEGWIIDEIKLEAYDALVVTDALQKIQWVSDGFSKMTGYSKSFAIGKSPHFLQGAKTTESSKNAIRKGLKNGGHFTQSVYNYRKNGAEYLCQIKLIPILGKEEGVTHYLALERELKAA